jgi:Resolvase, N terminal domain
VELRKKLTATGLDAGPGTIVWHLKHHHQTTVSRATVARYLAKHGLVVPEPKKRPKSSYIRFQAEQPNETWQADFTHYRLNRPDGRPAADTEILTWLDDHSRFALSVTAHQRVTGPIVLTAFRRTDAAYGIPASTLTDTQAWCRPRRSPDRPTGGCVVAEYFDVGMSRSLPWRRRPQAAALLTALTNPHRGFTSVVIGEPQRAFYGNQYGLTMPVFTHYGVRLWVPEVGGAIDPDSEAHDLIMSVFGGMSKRERSRIKIRVRMAMQAQAKIEGRFLGGRPPYGYRLADARIYDLSQRLRDGGDVAGTWPVTVHNGHRVRA